MIENQTTYRPRCALAPIDARLRRDTIEKNSLKTNFFSSLLARIMHEG
jgi:hypothetical protein